MDIVMFTLCIMSHKISGGILPLQTKDTHYSTPHQRDYSQLLTLDWGLSNPWQNTLTVIKALEISLQLSEEQINSTHCMKCRKYSEF